MHMVAGNAPLLQKVDGPAVHPHRPDGQDHGRRLALLAGPFDVDGDFVTHHHVEIVNGIAGDWLKLGMPEPLRFRDALGRLAGDLVDPGQVPALRPEAFHHRARERGE